MSSQLTERLINYWRQSLFVEPFVVLSFASCFIIGLFYHHNNRVRLFFVAYFFGGIILFAQNTLLHVFKMMGKQLATHQEAANTAFELLEFVAFYHFFKQSLRNSTFKKALKTSLYILSTVIAFFFAGLTFTSYSTNSIRVHSFLINVIEFFFLFGMCLAYFRELFTDVPTKNLFTRSSFLIVTSTFFYTILMIPFFLIANDIFLAETEIYNILAACHYILLIILLLSIAKAFLCKTPITI